MSKLSNQPETITDNQRITTAKKVKKIFGHINPESPPTTCPIRDILAPVSDKWCLLIVIFTGAYGTLRFNEIKKKVKGISSKILTERLRVLESDGYMKREVFPQVPIKVEYSLTPFGIRYLDKIIDLTQWIETESPLVIARRETKKPTTMPKT